MKKERIRFWAVALWLLVWQAASMAVGREILLVSPWRVLMRLAELAVTGAFWQSVLNTLGRISLGFLLAAAAGGVFAVLSSRFERIRELLAPLMLTIRTVPVASFIILALIWFSSKNLAILISFLMALPILYTNVLSGLDARDDKLREMTQVFRVPAGRRLRCVELPQALPYLLAACRLGVGLSWKAGTAAEVIGVPRGSIGEKLQQAKVYLDTPDLFAWTLVIVLLSLLFEKALLLLLRKAGKAISVPRETAGSGQQSAGQTRDIAVKGLSKAYDGKPVFRDLTLRFPAGSITAVMGMSGAGKTTLLRILMGLEQADAGMAEGTGGQRFVPVFQEDRLVPQLSVADNLRLVSPELTDAEIRDALHGMELDGTAGKRVETLSGGMCRRTALLRALLCSGETLILDEPFKGLDRETKERVIRETLRRRGGRTVILVTHDPEEAALMGADILDPFRADAADAPQHELHESCAAGLQNLQ